MNTSKYQLPGIMDVDDKGLLETYETFKAIDDAYNNSLIAMGMKTDSPASVSGNTNISLSNIKTISTK
jgi:hypothetical protein